MVIRPAVVLSLVLTLSSLLTSVVSAQDGPVVPAAPLFWVEEGDVGLVNIVWKAVPGADGYRVYRSTDGIGMNFGPFVFEGNTTIFADTITPTAAFFYKVTAYNTAGESPIGQIDAKYAGTLTVVVDDHGGTDSVTSDFNSNGTTSQTGDWGTQTVDTVGLEQTMSFATGGDQHIVSGTFTDQTFTWQTNANLTGSHDVFVNYMCDASRGIAHYDVFDGETKLTSAPVQVDQSLQSKDGAMCGLPINAQPFWKPIGTFSFSSQGRVVLVSATGNTVVADAAGFKAVSASSGSSSSAASSESSSSSSSSTLSSSSSSSDSSSSSSSTSSEGSEQSSSSSSSTPSGEGSSSSTSTSESASSPSASPMSQASTARGDTGDGNGGHRGANSNVVLAYMDMILGDMGFVDNVPPASFGGSDQVLQQILCPLKLKASERSYPMIAGRLAGVTGLDASLLLGQLTDGQFCEGYLADRRTEIQGVTIAPPKQVFVNAAGYPVSSNPVWNKCVDGTITLEDVRGNTDGYYSRQSGAFFPFSCDRYSLGGSENVADTDTWSFPDDPNLTITVRRNAGGLPSITVNGGYAVITQMQ